MKLTAETTHWIFLASSNGDTEERHIYDIVFGVYCLEANKINPQHITILIDGNNRAEIKNKINEASNYNHDILTSCQLFDILKANIYDNVVLFITGHGSSDGICATPPIKPYPLITAIKTAPRLKRGILILGQCYAGIFNYMDVVSKEDNGLLKEAPLVVIGATNLYKSISAPVTTPVLNKPISWLANIFLVTLFAWFKNPIDIDGDNKNTIMDAFKFAGFCSNDHNKYIKGQSFFDPIKADLEREKALKDENDTNLSGPERKQASLKAHVIKKQLDQHFDIRFNHQEPWILHSFLAQKIEF